MNKLDTIEFEDFLNGKFLIFFIIFDVFNFFFKIKTRHQNINKKTLILYS